MLCEAKPDCGCAGVHATLNLRTNGLHDVGARGRGVAIAQKMAVVRGQVVVSQRSVQRTARRDHTPPFCVLADFCSWLTQRTPCTLRTCITRSQARQI